MRCYKMTFVPKNNFIYAHRAIANPIYAGYTMSNYPEALFRTYRATAAIWSRQGKNNAHPWRMSK